MILKKEERPSTMYAEYTCEMCFKTYHSERDFVQCNGDVCREEICKECATKCKEPSCYHYTCENCAARPYMQGYCITHALFFDDEENNLVNFDYVGRGWSLKKALSWMKKVKLSTIQKNNKLFLERKSHEEPHPDCDDSAGS